MREYWRSCIPVPVFRINFVPFFFFNPMIFPFSGAWCWQLGRPCNFLQWPFCSHTNTHTTRWYRSLEQPWLVPWRATFLSRHGKSITCLLFINILRVSGEEETRRALLLPKQVWNFQGDSNKRWAVDSILSYFSPLPSLSRSLIDAHWPWGGEWWQRGHGQEWNAGAKGLKGILLLMHLWGKGF